MNRRTATSTIGWTAKHDATASTFCLTQFTARTMNVACAEWRSPTSASSELPTDGWPSGSVLILGAAASACSPAECRVHPAHCARSWAGRWPPACLPNGSVRPCRWRLPNRKPPAALIVHSDRGSSYASDAQRALLARHHLHGSVRRKANCWDNAVMARFFLNLKMERVWSNHYADHAEATRDITDYIVGFYSSARLHSTLG